MSLVALGMVRAVRVSADGIEIDRVMNCPGCPAAEAALAQAHARLRALNGNGTVTLRLLPQVWKPPWEVDGWRLI
jgi:metal-sulfur cluster biosynthetic enzyme